MYLKTIQLSNFRSFIHTEVEFSPDLTILVGENNSGKSNVIDAIRLLTTSLTGRREIYCEPTDIRFDSDDHRFELSATVADLSPAQRGRLVSAADSSFKNATFGLIYDENNKVIPVRPSWWAGHLRSVPEQGALQTIRHVFLPPLRDAKRALASGNPTRIYALLRHFLEDDDPDELASRLRRHSSDEILSKVDEAVTDGLSALTMGVRQQAATLGFATDEKLIEIARDLRFKLSDHDIPPEDLRYSGHGYANLLYMATIAVELEKVSSADLTLFLVEEPEAHLHPQLQAAVLGFLEDQAMQSKKRNSSSADGRTGGVQVVVATHSPNLSAWVDGRKLVVFRSLPRMQEEKEDKVSGERRAEGLHGNTQQQPPEPKDPAEPTRKPAPARRTTHCVALKDLGLDDVDWRKVDRYLDVTKSAVLFGGRVILVEGIAEALLLPVIARCCVLRERQDDFRRFRSAVFVPIGGVDFRPYVRLLATPVERVSVAERVVVVTDGDRGLEDEGKRSPGERRKEFLDTLVDQIGAEEICDVIVSTYSLEAELVEAGNEALLRTVYTSMHPRSEEKWANAVALAGVERAKALRDLFMGTAKGDLAHRLAERIRTGEDFTAPDYLQNAIESLIQ